MSRLVARILLAMLMFPLAAVVYLTVWYTLDVHTSLPTFRCLMAAGLAAWVGVAVYWTSLWRAGVPGPVPGWSGRRSPRPWPWRPTWVPRWR